MFRQCVIFNGHKADPRMKIVINDLLLMPNQQRLNFEILPASCLDDGCNHLRRPFFAMPVVHCPVDQELSDLVRRHNFQIESGSLTAFGKEFATFSDDFYSLINGLPGSPEAPELMTVKQTAKVRLPFVFCRVDFYIPIAGIREKFFSKRLGIERQQSGIIRSIKQIFDGSLQIALRKQGSLLCRHEFLK